MKGEGTGRGGQGAHRGGGCEGGEKGDRQRKEKGNARGHEKSRARGGELQRTRTREHVDTKPLSEMAKIFWRAECTMPYAV